MIPKKIHLGEILVEKKLITSQQLETAIQRHHVTGEKLGHVLIELGLIKENALLQLLCQQLNISYIDLKNYKLDLETVSTLPEFYARHYRAIVLKNTSNELLIGMSDPEDLSAFDALNQIIKRPFQVALVREVDLLHAIDTLYRHTTEISHLAEELSEEINQVSYDVDHLSQDVSSSDAPVVKLLQSVFEDAVQMNASDIHIEPEEQALRIRQRIDGLLHENVISQTNIAAALTLRLKLMGRLNITEKRLPQDGRFSIKVRKKMIDVRLSTLPVQFGESVVMRLLDRSQELLTLDKIGMSEMTLKQFRHAISFPHGLILITGPTGSGKTSTLYGMLKELNTEDNKIITVEDPIEYTLPRVNQVQVRPDIDLTFANVLRSVLRQDPDIIMVGELRDQETANIAIRAAMTGHLVLSTLHTNDALSTVARLIDMGVESYLIASILKAVMAQRLVRRICTNCIADYQPSLEETVWLKGVNYINAILKGFKKGVGCVYCHKTGYLGQIGLFELLTFNPLLVEALQKNNLIEFNKLAMSDKNFQPLIYSGLKLIGDGVTTISEIMRIVGENAVTDYNNARKDKKATADADI